MCKGNECAWKRCKTEALASSPYCSKHKHKKRKQDDPLGYYYDNLKQNARRRQKLFTLTKEQFGKFCEETGYLEKKGKGAGKYHIDRINPELGYSEGNIQILECMDNINKYHKEEKQPF